MTKHPNFPLPTGERPLVTFALFSYNQEQYIREAIEGAFAQTYEPLEIILSDDCSTDKTFEIIQEIAQSYQGPHKVVVLQTPNNLGTLLHVAYAAKVAMGDLFVLAAGDDISKPNRVDTLVNQWLQTGAWGLYSRFDRINGHGEVIARNQESSGLASPSYRLRQYFYDDEGEIQIVHGCTSAYDMRVFGYLTLTSEDYVLAEDGLLSVLLNLLGKRIEKVDDSLVLYRETDDSLTNSNSLNISFSSIKTAETGVVRLARSQANRCRLFLRMDKALGENKARRLNAKAVFQDMERQSMLAGINDSLFSERLKYLLFNPNAFSLRWVLPRLFGVNVFFVVKFIFNRVLYLFGRSN